MLINVRYSHRIFDFFAPWWFLVLMLSLMVSKLFRYMVFWIFRISEFFFKVLCKVLENLIDIYRFWSESAKRIRISALWYTLLQSFPFGRQNPFPDSLSIYHQILQSSSPTPIDLFLENFCLVYEIFTSFFLGKW